MSSLLPIIVLLGVVALYTGIVKLAALLCRRSRLAWRDACIFSLILLVVIGFGTLLNRLSDNVVSNWLAFFACLVIHAGIGAWHLAPRARTAAGEPLGSNRAALLALTAYVLLMPIVLLVAEMFSAMRH